MASPSVPSAPKLPEMRDFGDALTTRRFIYEDVFDAASKLEPLSDAKHTLKLRDVAWADPDRFTRRQRKQAILAGETLARRLRGTWDLIDNATGSVIQSRPQVVARVPYLSSMGTFTHRGNEYTVNQQQRLRPGVFTRVKDNGELESHANIMPGKGSSHRYNLDPNKGVFKLNLAQSEMPLLPLLRLMGATDPELREAWGPELLASNYQKSDSVVIRKLAAKLLKPADLEDPQTSRQKLIEVFNRMELDPEVTRRTLGSPYARMDKDAILATTRKLLAVSRGQQEPDDRDHLAYQQFYGPEDLFSERIRRDHGRQRAMLFRKISQAGSLDKMPAGALTPQIEQVLVGSGLAQALEEINPAEVFDKQSRITRMGEGGIPSLDSIPNEARSVQPSHMNYMDPVRTPESERLGVDVHMARNARKGRDGSIYSRFIEQKTGKEVWKSPRDVADASLTTPESMRRQTKLVPVMKGGKLDYVTKEQVDYVLPDFEGAFSPLGNMVPLKSAVKPQRVAMASRMLTQALALKNPEAPLVQSGMPGKNGSRSFEQEYGSHMGAVAADKAGRVVGFGDGVLSLRYDDGTTGEVELYDHHPFNRKSYVHQTPMVQVGQRFDAGQTIVKSNYTDDTGTAALGLNARVAYFPYLGYNIEDAAVISESMAKRMTSEHMYQHDVEVSPRHKMGKNAFINLFANKYDRKTLDTLDEKGVVRPGATVEYGQPIILAARERDRAQNKIHKKRQAGYVDDSVVWKHHDAGVVTDVVWGKSGPVVLVKSSAPMQVGDKLSGRYGDKSVVSAIIPDDRMPHGEDGKPFELLLNPNSVISRTNPAQKLEAWLGKVALKDGTPIRPPDFENDNDLDEWVNQQMRQRGLKPTEDVLWPERKSTVKGVPTGNRFIMKLHHTAESKGQGRSSGGYTMDDAPAKGGETGCFVGDTPIRIYIGKGTLEAPIGKIVEERFTGMAASADLKTGFEKCRRQVIDWFHYQVPRRDLVTIELDDGRTLTCTRNHELILADGSRKRAGELLPGDDLMEAP